MRQTRNLLYPSGTGGSNPSLSATTPKRDERADLQRAHLVNLAEAFLVVFEELVGFAGRDRGVHFAEHADRRLARRRSADLSDIGVADAARRREHNRHYRYANDVFHDLPLRCLVVKLTRLQLTLRSRRGKGRAQSLNRYR